MQLFIEIALIKAVHRGRRDGEVGEGGRISSSAHKLNGAKKFLPDEGIPTTGQTCQHHHQQFSTLLQVFTMHFGTLTFLMYLVAFCFVF